MNHTPFQLQTYAKYTKQAVRYLILFKQVGYIIHRKTRKHQAKLFRHVLIRKSLARNKVKLMDARLLRMNKNAMHLASNMPIAIV